MGGKGSLRRILAAAGLAAVCAVAAAAVVLRAAPRETPRAAAPLPVTRGRGTTAPWRVGIQAGHWQIDQLPDEQRRLRADTGAQWGSITESAVNLEIARRVVNQLQGAGVSAELLPATVPPGYDADAFVAIHADDGGGSAASGWKIATPWRASEASRLLRDDIAKAYARVSGLPEDRYGISYNMKGYYGFSWYRFEHAVAPTTPSAIIETGFLTSATDRALIVKDPERAASAISQGILAYLGELSKLPDSALVPMDYPPMEVASDNAALRWYPSDTERIKARLPSGTWVRPFDERDGWTELVIWGNFRMFGWVKDADLKPFTISF